MLMRLVKEFQSKYPEDLELNGSGKDVLTFYANTLKSIAATIEDNLDRYPDVALLRAHFLVEELGELLEAMASGDRVSILDALVDLDYFQKGTVLIYKLDAYYDEACVEVHRSNMSKTKSDIRLRDKGEGYDPPNLEPFV